MSKSKINNLEEEIRKLKEERRQTVKKSRKLVDEVNDFQENLGKDLVPLQRIGYVIFFLLLLGLGIYYIVADKETEHVTVGIIIIVLGLVVLGVGWAWTSAVRGSKSLAKINALQFEIGMAKDAFGRK